MRIVLTTPAFTAHGGIRIILEWANRFSARGHEVAIYCAGNTCPPEWFNLSDDVALVGKFEYVENYDVLVICSPHDIELAYRAKRPAKVVLFLQMLEHMFKPTNNAWQILCNRYYASVFPLVTISSWIVKYLKAYFPSRGDIYLVGNGVNLDDFPLEPECKKDHRTVLVEGWNCSNPTKDSDRLGPKIARELRQRGYQVLAYDKAPIRDYIDAVNEYHCCPTLEVMNSLYRRATILLKASRCDARSCAPMEAMTKGTVTARAINQGDDDLINWENCIRVPYEPLPFRNAVNTILNGKEVQEKLRAGCFKHLQQNSWDKWMPRIEELVCNA